MPNGKIVKRSANLITARGITELRDQIDTLSNEGFRIITVIDTQNGDYHIVAQKDCV